jgi:hypothetical protein
VGKPWIAVLPVAAVLLLAGAIWMALIGETDVANTGSGHFSPDLEVPASDESEERDTGRSAAKPVPPAGGSANRHASGETGERSGPAIPHRDSAPTDEAHGPKNAADAADGQGSAADLPERPKHLQFQLPDGRILEESDRGQEWSGWKLEAATLGFEYGMAYHTLYGNHSEVLGEEEVEIGDYRATLALIERTTPAAAESEEPSWEYWLYVAEPATNGPGYGYAYCLIVHADERSEEARQAALEIGSTLRLTPRVERQE